VWEKVWFCARAGGCAIVARSADRHERFAFAPVLIRGICRNV